MKELQQRDNNPAFVAQVANGTRKYERPNRTTRKYQTGEVKCISNFK